MSQHFYVTLHGIPLNMNLNFPFHPSAGGADYFVLHGNAALADGSGLYAEVAVHMSQVVKEVVNVDGPMAVAAAINSIRKTVDTKDIEFLKSTKKQPVHLSSRMWSIVQERFTFHTANDEQVARFLEQKAYWTKKVTGSGSLVEDDNEALYLGVTTKKLCEIAEAVAVKGIIQLSNGKMDAGRLEAAAIESRTREALQAIAAKHEFERTAAHP
jgi:hypothetical protein